MPNRRSIIGGPSKRLTNMIVMREFCRMCAAVSDPEPLRSAIATVCVSNTTTELPGARGLTLTWWFVLVGAVARKNTFRLENYITFGHRPDRRGQHCGRARAALGRALCVHLHVRGEREYGRLDHKVHLSRPEPFQLLSHDQRMFGRDHSARPK